MIKIFDKNKHTTEVFDKMPVPQALLTMAVPTVMAQLIVLIYSLADTFYIGQTNNPNMVAAVSLLLPIYNLTLPLANMTGVGGGTLISRLLARDKGDEAKKVCALSFYVCIAIAFTYATIFLVCMDPILHGLGANDDVYVYAKTYTLFVIVCGAIPTGLSNAMASLIRSCGYSKEAGVGITFGGIINIILDPIFMFVLFPKGQEVTGAAVATLLSNILALIYFFIVSHRIKNVSSINYSLRLGLPTKESIKELFAIGIPVSINSFLFDIDYIVLDKLMSTYGAISLAALGIVLKAERLPLNTGV
ncbi:MAG: polysaccharide biosynthesis C-terminal domain-containing protein, partial [Lachnospiraceae bacterium]|nr:polysaccharide biosynthesis C-terminal domain-containing protein [Lachnospiraceae bacterium]